MQDAFRRCLEECDVDGIRKLWAHVSPHLPQPQTDDDALAAIHHARTQASSVAFKLRAYSHRWLTERELPSGLPDSLRPAAERLYGRIVSAVGIAVGAMSPHREQEAIALRSAMSDAVAEAYADGRTEPAYVTARMNEARERFTRRS